MITLGGLILSDNLILDGLESAPVVPHSVRKTLGNRTVVRTLGGSATGGRTLTLAGTYFFTLGDVEAIRALAGAGQVVLLSHPRGTFSVFITKIEAEPLVQYSDPASEDLYAAIIYLQEV